MHPFFIFSSILLNKMKKNFSILILLACFASSPLVSLASVGFDDYGQVNLISTSTIVTASGYSGGYEPQKAIDQNYATAWFDQEPTIWIKLNFGIPKVVNLIDLSVLCETSGPNLKNIDIEASNDDSNFTLLYSKIATTTEYCNNGGRQYENFLFSNDTSFRYYKITVTSWNSTNYAWIWELSAYNTKKNYHISGFSYGEILMIFLLLMIFINQFFSSVKDYIFGIRLENPPKAKYDKDV